MEKIKTVDFSETLAACDPKIGQLFDLLMVLVGEPKSRISHKT